MLKLLLSLLELSGAKRFQGKLSFICLTLVLSSAPAGAKATHPEAIASHDNSEGIATYNWNLSERQRPLLDLPDQLTANLELSLSYPMVRFAFPLFQSLYFNKRSDEYMLMVVPKVGRRAGLISLRRTGQANTYNDRTTGFLLVDQNDVKIIRSSDGIEYTFARFGDGEFRCSRVRDGHSPALTLAYANDNLLQGIVETGGRTIRLNYQSSLFASITQTWNVNSTLLSRTWKISENQLSAQRAHADYSLPKLLRMAKPVPRNATTPNYTCEMAESDRTLARIFGDPGAVAAANGFEPEALASEYPLYRGDVVADDGRRLRGHLSFAMHLYGSADGSGGSAVYVPAGFMSHSVGPTPTDAAVTFYYPRLGKLTNITLVVFHVANFGIRYEGGRVRIGNIGGPGGSSAPYKHSHIEFYRGNTGLPASAARPNLRIDPVSVFDPGAQAASSARN